MLSHSIIKQAAPLICFTLYLMVPNNRMINKVTQLIYGLPFMVAIYYLLELNMVSGTWRTLATPLQYSIFIVAIYHQAKGTYGLALSTNMAILSGYLYEIPRYLYLQGLHGLIRVNRYSLFYVDYALISVIAVAYLLYVKQWKPTRTIAYAATIYLAYVGIYYFDYGSIICLKQQIAWLGSIRVPWICLYRVPAMLMLWVTTKNLNIKPP